MSHPPYSGEVREEIWRSLVSLLRAYSGAAALRHGEHSVTETPVGTVMLNHKDVSFDVSFESVTGEGSWRLSRRSVLLDEGVFRIGADGRFAAGGGEEWELDHVAIEWVARLSGAAAQHREAGLAIGKKLTMAGR